MNKTDAPTPKGARAEERWTLDAARKGKKDAPRLCFAGENCRTIELNGDVFEHVEVVPAAALEQAVHETDQYWRDKMDSALAAERARAQNFLETLAEVNDRWQEAQKEVANIREMNDILFESAKKSDIALQEAQREVERLTRIHADVLEVEAQHAAALAAERERACPNPNEHLAGWSAKCDDFMKRAEEAQKERDAARESFVALNRDYQEAQKAEKVAADSAHEWSEKWHGLRKQLLEAQKEVEFLMLCLAGISHWTRCSNHYAGHPDDGPCMRCQLEAAEAKIDAMREVVEKAASDEQRLYDQCREQMLSGGDKFAYAAESFRHVLVALAALRDGKC